MRQQSITDLAREHLEKAIYTGALQPGDQIKEEPIAEALAISRPPIREAFKLLEGEGLVVRKPRRGVFVARINARDAWEIYTLKAELYDFSITLSFHRLTEDHLDRMGRLVERMEACVRADAPDILSYLKMNGRFHAVHVDAAGHERLKQILGMLHKQIRCFSYQTHSVREHLERS
ncbi:MAG: GntR family transcriptional regulator, partial [Desulfobacterales bacterium]|nr:GntR family transcriptional regulator [Desulfobacterales bacterium]